MTTKREHDGIAALAADAIRTARVVARKAAILISSGAQDERLPALAALVIVEGPTCPQCRCWLAGTSPTNCPGCGAIVAWSIETRIV